MTFEDLGLSDHLLAAVKACGYEKPTPIQETTIPIIYMARDVVGLAQTGTGKTASFILPMIDILDGGRAKARMPRSLVLSPTRELAAQTAENFDIYGKNSKLSKALLIGGASMDEQIKRLERGVDVLIATPGRLIDLFERGNILLNDIKILVIDEADRMLDMGFIPDIEKICSLLPATRQTLLFSATMPPEIKRLTKKFLSNPREITVTPAASAAETVEQFCIKTTKAKKNAALESIIKKEDVSNAFIFCNRKSDVDTLSRWLKKKGHSAQAMHGDLQQTVRMKTLDKFKAGDITLLVCSDVAARGIDVDNVSHVFNYDVPMNPDDYVHRIGRTGRAGHKGRAWMLVTKQDDKQLAAVEKRIHQSILCTEMPEDLKNSKKDTTSQGAKKYSGTRSDDVSDDVKGKKVPARKKPLHNSLNDNEDGAEVSGFGDHVPAFFKF
ncbi:MAG: DEAD/DEAH box helicase [Alphaproteobacteria bacterium]